MRILVTGGAGFIGSHAVRRFLDEGCEVLTVDKLTYAGSLKNLGPYKDRAGHRFEHLDICSAKKILHLMEDFRPDAVLHAAAETHVDRSIDGPDLFIQTNIVGTHAMIDAATHYWQGAGCRDNFRFVHLSTDEVYGSLGPEGFFTETSPYQPNSPYSASKASSDLLVRGYHKTYGIPAVILNAANTYGPNQFPEKLIPLMILTALQEKPLPVYGKGNNVRDWVYVSDHADALWRVVSTPHAVGSYCLGGGTEITNIDIVTKICSLLDEKQPRKNGLKHLELISHVTDRPGHDFRYASVSAKLQAETGWSPAVSIEAGLNMTVDWYLQNRDRFTAMLPKKRMGL